MSACFAAVFGTPIAAAVFALEVVSVGVMYYAALVPCAVSALVASMVAHAFHIDHLWSSIVGIPAFSVKPAIMVGILGGLCAIVSYIFCKSMSNTAKIAEKYIKNEYVRTVVGAVIVIALALLFGTRDYLGAGTDIIQKALSGEASTFAFLLKILFTAITLAAAFKGGEIIPTFFVGATFGAVV